MCLCVCVCVLERGDVASTVAAWTFPYLVEASSSLKALFGGYFQK